MDSTSNLDTKLFHLICPTPAGGLPLGNILTSKEDESVISAGIKLYKSILPEKAFFGRGPNVGPKILMTDDCAAERNALAKNWADSVLLLCIFHLLQAYWRYLWNSDHKVEKCDRQEAFNSFKMVVYACNENEYCLRKKSLLNNKTIKKYPKLLQHLMNDLLPRKEEWALTTRIEKRLATHNVNTTNYAEISFRITKENQFNRIKAYNMADLLDVLLDDSVYYVRRCIDIGNNRVSEFRNQRSRYFAKKTNINVDKIVRIESEGNSNEERGTFRVPSETVDDKFYDVNMDLGLCECPMGRLRGPCKHKHVVAEHFNLVTPDVIPTNNSRTRAFFHFIATGTERDPNWYRSLSNIDEIEQGPSHDLFGYMRNNSNDAPNEYLDQSEDSDENDNCNDILIPEFENTITEFSKILLPE